MQIATRLLFNGFVGQLAQLNGLDPSLTVIPGELKQFAVAPVIEQRLQAKLQLTSDFMSRINVIPVAAQQGARVGVGVGRSLASRTDTAAGHRRNPTDPTSSDVIDQYFCKKTDYDYAWGYTLLDAWSQRQERRVRISRIALEPGDSASSARLVVTGRRTDVAGPSAAFAFSTPLTALSAFA